MTIETKPFDAAEYLDTPEAVAAFLDEALESGDPAFVAKSLGIIARSKGMSALAKETGLQRQNLYTALSEDGNPRLDTFLKVISAFGLKLHAEPILEAA